ncbi:MAG: glycosyltransferase family 2 protein [Balneolaceae bacterium]
MHFTYPKISIVTPSFNSEDYLESTIQSVLRQTYPNLEYVIIDGGSTDRSVQIIKKYENELAYWISEKDSGLYHALNKGFKQTSGEIMGWINSDDMYHTNAFFTIAEIFSEYDEVKWLLGSCSAFDERGRTVNVRHSKEFTRDDFLKGDFKWIQQESCLWKRELWDKSGGALNEQLKYAGDFELWMRFFRHEPLWVTNALIGGFRLRRSGQLSSENYPEYLSEVEKTIRLEKSLPIKTKKRPRQGIRFDRKQQRFILTGKKGNLWRRSLVIGRKAWYRLFS